jgi:hypothetical protein
MLGLLGVMLGLVPHASSWLFARTPQPQQHRAFRAGLLVAAVASPRATWQALKTALDGLPVFAVTDEAFSPLEYELEGKSLAFCFASADGARVELERARAANPALSLRIQPVGLGTALERVREGRGRLVAAAGDLAAARLADPDGEDWDGGALPLFGCHQLRTQDGGATPLFLSVEEAKAAMASADPERKSGASLVTTSLQRMSNMLQLGEMGTAVDFVPPRRSLEFCAGGTLGSSILSEREEALPPGVTRGAVRRALPDMLGLQDQAGSGLFPR